MLIFLAVSGWALALLGWFAFWAVQDQVGRMIDERDDLFVDLMRSGKERRTWERRALDAERNIEMLLREPIS